MLCIIFLIAVFMDVQPFWGTQCNITVYGINIFIFNKSMHKLSEMRSIPIALITLFIISCSKSGDTITPILPVSDSFTVSVNNGYGSGKYKIGDTVHIFSNAYNSIQLFDKWTGDINALNASGEWHTFLIMPNTNINVTGTIKNIPAYTLQLEQIRGRDRLKPVYYFFPTNHKGIVYLLHGSGGNAQNLVNNYEANLLARELVNDGFAIIITEAEEATTGVDVDADGKLRWATAPVDTLTNVDYVNIRNITDTFYNRGVTNRSKPRYSVGMSNGGAFSSTLSYAYNFKAGVSYCAQMGGVLAQVSTIPFQFCMARFDSHENVGPQGNANALANSNTLTGRGICSKYFIKERAPIYPERFSRRGDISIAQSQAVFAELKAKNFLDSRNYFMGNSSTLVTAYQASPASYPVITGLTIPQIVFMLEQIDLSVSDHQMYSDYNKATLKFLNTQCL